MKEAMELVHVTHLKERDYTTLSDGQKQRILLARAICQNPSVLILDEPTSYLDICHKLEFLSMLQRLSKEKKLTVIMSLHELEMAEKVSDKILCIGGQGAERFGTPEDIFTKGYINRLFSVKEGSCDEENTSWELAAVKGKPEIFVIAGGGRGRNLYRKLQRQGIPFAAGILYENDLDVPVAKALASEVIVQEAFEPVTEEVFLQAKQSMEKCKKVICCQESFGSLEKDNERLLCYAAEQGKEIYGHKDCYV